MTKELTLLGEVSISPEDWAATLRQAGIRLAGIALRAQDGDEDRAAVMLRPALEAIGALPYEVAQGKYRWGQAT